MSRAAPRRTAAVLALVLAVPAALAGCASLPESGPVVEADVSSSGGDREPSDIIAVPPQPDDTAIEIALGFLEAMTASPIRTDVARQFLASAAADQWDPEAGTTIYASQQTPSGEGRLVTVPLTDAARFGPSGSWRGPLPAGEQRLELELSVENGEYRITNPPDGLVVPASWFTQRFEQASLYFFDPSGRILVPQPVFVPRGEQLASTLISRLLAGPGDGLRRVVRSFVPLGLTVSVGVPVSPQGVADISLLGDAGTLGEDVTDRLLAQLAWTLRQVPGITALRVSINGAPVRSSDGGADYRVDDAGVYDPAGVGVDEEVYGLRDGVLGVRESNDLLPVPGPLGTTPPGIRSVSVALDGDRAAGVSLDGRRLLVGELGEDTEGLLDTGLRGTDLLTPAWDFAGHVWTVDRSAEGAVVRYLEDGRVRRVPVPGVSGRRVTSFLVSRDSTRFVAVVRAEAGDELRIGRVEVDAAGRIFGVGPTEVIGQEPGEQARVRDLAWTSPTTLAVLLPVRRNQIYEVRTVSVDGAPLGVEGLSTTVTGRVTGLVGAPAADEPLYAVADTDLVDLNGGSRGFVGAQSRSLGYPG